MTYRDYYLDESIIKGNMVDISVLNRAYELFSNSYIKSTGKSWDRDKFLRAAENWVLYGDEGGYVATRPQQSGLIKLVGVAGGLKSVTRGFDEMMSHNSDKPVWGMVSVNIAKLITKKDSRFRMFVLPGGVVGRVLFKAVKQAIPGSVFGGAKIVGVNADGSIRFEYRDVGEVDKVLIGNEAYYELLRDKIRHLDKLPDVVKNKLASLI